MVALSALWENLGINYLTFDYLSKYNLQTAIADGVATSVVLATGKGADFALASAAMPINIVIDAEAMDVTGRSADTLTVIRGQRGTTAVAHSTGTLNVKALLPVEMPFIKQCN